MARSDPRDDPDRGVRWLSTKIRIGLLLGAAGILIDQKLLRPWLLAWFGRSLGLALFVVAIDLIGVVAIVVLANAIVDTTNRFLIAILRRWQ
jgi:hypothetical protein